MAPCPIPPQYVSLDSLPGPWPSPRPRNLSLMSIRSSAPTGTGIRFREPRRRSEWCRSARTRARTAGTGVRDITRAMVRSSDSATRTSAEPACADLGNNLFVPQTGELRWNAAPKDDLSKGYRAKFEHSSEKASPGYYSVKLESPDIGVELAAAPRAAIHRYTYPNDQEAKLLIDLRYKIGNSEYPHHPSGITIEDDYTVSGWQQTDGWAGDKTWYFVAKFSKPITQRNCRCLRKSASRRETPPASVGDVKAKIDLSQSKSSRKSKFFPIGNGVNVKAGLNFGKLSEPLVIKVGLSPVSVEGARRNLAAENREEGFRRSPRGRRQGVEHRTRAHQDHQRRQGARDHVSTPRCITASSPPRSTATPTALTWGNDRQVHKDPGFSYYSTFSLWDNVPRGDAALHAHRARARERFRAHDAHALQTVENEGAADLAALFFFVPSKRAA